VLVERERGLARLDAEELIDGGVDFLADLVARLQALSGLPPGDGALLDTLTARACAAALDGADPTRVLAVRKVSGSRTAT
jgi:hypothetical protein